MFEIKDKTLAAIFEEALNRRGVKKAFELLKDNFNHNQRAVIRALEDAGVKGHDRNRILHAAAHAWRPEKADQYCRDIDRDIHRHDGTESKGSHRQGRGQSSKRKMPDFPKGRKDLALRFKDQPGDWFPPGKLAASEMLSALFATADEPDPLLCLGESNAKFWTKRLSRYKRLSSQRLRQMSLIVPSPMSSATGMKADSSGHSAHTLNNTGSRRYLVVEFDNLPGGEEIPTDAQLGTLNYLSDLGPLVAVVSSGGKSLHGWFRVDTSKEKDLETFLKLACLYGADKVTWKKEQFVRLPGGTRDNGKRQKILHWDPETSVTWNHKEITEELASVTGAIRPNKVIYLSNPGRYYLDLGTHYREFTQKTPVRRGIEKYFREVQGLGKDAVKEATQAAFDDIEITRAVDWAGEIAGMSKGIVHTGGQQRLIRRGPSLVGPKEGDFPLIEGILTQAFRLAPEARVLWEAWLGNSFRGVQSGEYSPDCMLVMAGEAGAGKSLLAWLITAALGGRSFNPLTTWTGGTIWNDSLLGSEVLLIDDSQSSSSPRDRQKFGAKIKEALFADKVEIQKRNTTAMSLRPVWRLVVCVNELPENLAVIPPLDEGIEDKIHLFRIARIQMPLPAQGGEERKKLRDALSKELPAFLHHCLSVEVPAGYTDSRMASKAWQDPALLEALKELSPDKQLEDLLEMALRKGHLKSGWMTASDVGSSLRQRGVAGHEIAESLLRWAPNTGRYLSNLHKKG